MQPGNLAEWFGALAQCFGSLAACCGAGATFLAVAVAMGLAVGPEPLQRLVQRRGEVEIVEHKQTRQQTLLMTRLRVKNKAWLSDQVTVYVTEILGRADFIEVPLLWLHWRVEGDTAPVRRTIGAEDRGWVDFVTVDKGVGPGPQPSRMYLNIGAGAGTPELQLLHPGRTKLTLRIDPRYGRAVEYKATVEWNGEWEHPAIAYTKTKRQAPRFV